METELIMPTMTHKAVSLGKPRKQFSAETAARLGQSVAAQPPTFLESIATTDKEEFLEFSMEQIEKLNELETALHARPIGARYLDCQRNVIAGYLPSHCGTAYYPVPYRCNLKFCRKCRKSRLNRLVEQYMPFLDSFRYPRCITLTFKNVPTIAKEYREYCYKKWRALKEWLNNNGYEMNKGLINKEVTHHPVGSLRKDREGKQLYDKITGDALLYTEEDAGYHYHFHIVFDGKFIKQAVLQERWQKITKSKSIPFIHTPKGGRNRVLQYILKYLTKEEGITEFNALYEYLKVSKGQREIQPFGLKRKPLRRKVYVCKTCDTPVSGITLHASITPSKPKDRIETREFPYLVYYEDNYKPTAQKAQPQVTSKVIAPIVIVKKPQLPTHKLILQHLKTHLEATYEELEVVCDQPIEAAIEGLSRGGDIFSPKPGRYRILQ